MAGIDREALRVLREKDGYGRAEFAKKIVNPTTGKTLSLQYLLDIESGIRTLKRNPGLIKAFAEVLNVPVSMLVDAPGARTGGADLRVNERLTLNAAEVAELIGASESHVRRQIAAGAIPSFKLGDRVLVHRDVLEAWLLEQASPRAAS